MDTPKEAPGITPVAPSVNDFKEAAQKLLPHIVYTPVIPWVGKVIQHLLSAETEVFAKLEIFQYAGSFKARAALLKILECTAEEKQRGVVAVSAGNHAIAVSYAAETLGVSAKVVMPESVSKVRLLKCRLRGAEVILMPSFAEAFVEAERIAVEEGRVSIHPFEGRTTALGTGTLGLEFINQVALDAVVVSVGGGGLAAGVAAAVRQAEPRCVVYGVEPTGADSISRSLESNSLVTLERIETIATSLSAPYSLPYSFSLCQQYLTDVVRVSDQEMCEAMAFLFHELKLAVEPGCAAVVAGLLGPLRKRLLGKRVGIVLCGSSIDPPTYTEQLNRGELSYQKLVSEML